MPAFANHRSRIESKWFRRGPAQDSLLVLFGALVAQIIAFNPYLNLYDEGIILYGAERVSNGEVPYRDFWTMYGPAPFYLYSFLYSVFGATDLVVRVTGIVIKAIIASLTVLLVSRLAPRPYGLLAALFVLLLLIAVREDAFPVFPALALAMLSILFTERGVTQGSKTSLAVAGICTGLVTAFRHDLGAYTAVATVVSLMLWLFLVRDRRGVAGIVGTGVQWLLAYGVGILLIVLPVAILLFHAVPVRDLYENLIYIPAHIYPDMRALPFPGVGVLRDAAENPAALFEFAVYMPFLAVLWSILVELRHVGSKRRQGVPHTDIFGGAWVLIPLIMLTCLLFTLKGLVRVSTIHMVQSLVLATILLAICAARVRWNSRAGVYLFMPGLLLSAVLVALPAHSGAQMVIQGIRDLAGADENLITRCIRPVLPRLRCVTTDQNYIQAARFITGNTSEEDRIYVGVTRHDRIFINAVAFYFMTGRQSVTKWHELHPGVQTRARIQREMIAEIKAEAPPFVILDERWEHMKEPNASRHSSGVTLLDEFIHDEFQEVRRYGTVRILARTSDS